VFALVGLALATLVGCGGEKTDGSSGDEHAPTASVSRRIALDRADAVQAATRRWADASTLTQAQAAAEDARNLITGPHAPGAWDANADGESVRVDAGLLPGEDGSEGLASSLATGCVERDVLGGSWADPEDRWEELTERIEQWRPDNNTFPALPSHAQRVVGWATLTLRADGLAQALKHSGHASGHAQIVREALRDPEASPCPG